MSDERRGDVPQTPHPGGLRANCPRSALIGLAIATAIIRASRLDREQLVQQRGSRGILRQVLTVSVALLILVSACAQQLDNTRTRVNVKTLAKTDIDNVLDIHVREARSYCRRLMIKLYKRNPRELRKSAVPDINRNLRRIFNETHNWQFEELDNRKGVDAIYLTFDESFEGDRVFAFIAGLTSMIMASYDYQSDFYMFDTVDPQKLYNSARNIEIAVWKLGHDLNANGEPFLYSNSMPGEVTNLSYERLFGKLIATQDTIALIIAGRTNRVIRKVIQRMATAAFLPI